MAKSAAGSVAVSTQIDAETHADLKALAARMHCPTDQIVADAIRSYVHHERAFIAAVEEGIAAADAGRLVDHDDVVAALRERNRLLR